MTTTKLLTQLSRVAAAAAVCLGAVGASQAMILEAGDYIIRFANVDSGTTYNPPGAGLFCGGTANTQANRDSCDTAALVSAAGGGGVYDTMGIFSVDTIRNTTTGELEYTSGTASTIGGITVGPYLTGIFGGLIDFAAAFQPDAFGAGGTIRTLSAGGYFTIFNNTADWDISIGPTAAGVNFQPGAQTYPGISPGSPAANIFLSGVFVDGEALAGNSDAGYVSNFDSQTLAGGGSGFLNFTGGAAQYYFDTDTVTGNNGGKVDAKITTTIQPATGDVAAAGWLVTSTSDITGFKVPEPGSLALVSLALLGMGGLARRKAKAGK